VRSRFACLAICAAAALSACGNSRVAPPDVAAPQPPRGTHLVSWPRSGVSVAIPDNWRAEQGSSPLVASIASGTATVAIWRYWRTEPLPGSAGAFRRAKRELVRAARKRDRTLRVRTARVVRFDGRPALQIVGVETVAGQRRMVRSTHVFRERSEVVVEALAPPAAFGGLARTVFDPLLRSLVIRPLPR
jgi:hypothetical protein